MGDCSMRKTKKWQMLFAVLLLASISFYVYIPKNIHTALKRIDGVFEVGEVLAVQPVEEDMTAVIYTNKERPKELQNALVHKKGTFYDVIELNGSLHMEKAGKLKQGLPRTNMLLSWYDNSDQCIIMVVAYDEDVADIVYRGEKLTSLNIDGYHLFYGFGSGKYEIYELYDKYGNLLENYKE